MRGRSLAFHRFAIPCSLILVLMILVAPARLQGDGLGAMMQRMLEGDFESLMARESGRGTGYNAALLAAAFTMGAGASSPSSFVVPSLLFEDVALSKQNGERMTPPLSDPPPGN